MAWKSCAKFSPDERRLRCWKRRVTQSELYRAKDTFQNRSRLSIFKLIWAFAARLRNGTFHISCELKLKCTCTIQYACMYGYWCMTPRCAKIQHVKRNLLRGQLQNDIFTLSQKYCLLNHEECLTTFITWWHIINIFFLEIWQFCILHYSVKWLNKISHYFECFTHVCYRAPFVYLSYQ